MSGTHEHGHGHGHPPRPDLDDTPTYYRAMEEAVRELLVEKGLVTAGDIQREIEKMDARAPANGARAVARAWADPAFKARLVETPREAVAEIGHDIGPMRLVVLENTPAVHNMVVCTLCSCYPRWLLGTPPDWYKSRAYRSRAVREPRAVLREFGLEIAADREVRVHDSTADMRYLVLPMRPEGTDGMGEEALAALVGRDAMIGVAEALAPAPARAAAE